jgi:hypothetical protein
MSAHDALALAISTATPVVLWGPPGSGKTSVVMDMARALGVPCEVVVASIREPTDFAGLPVVDAGTVRFAPPRWAQNLAEAGKGLLFLDEVSTAPPSVQAALLRVVLDRTVGDLELPHDVRIVAAANPADEAADGWELTYPLANRFVHLAWMPDALTVAAGILGGFAPVTPPELPPTWWEDHGPKARALVASFLACRPHLVSDLPKQGAKDIRGFPTPRTWAMATRFLAACDAVRADDETIRALIVGCVGPGPALELRAFARDDALPDPEGMIADPHGCALPQRGDRRLAALTAMVAAVLSNPSLDRWQRGWKVLARAADPTPDVAAIAARALAANRPSGARMPPEVKVFSGILRQAGRAVA